VRVRVASPVVVLGVLVLLASAYGGSGTLKRAPSVEEVAARASHCAGAVRASWQQRLETVSKQLAKVPGVSTAFFTPDIANHVPHMQITWDPKMSLTPAQASQVLRSGSPSIAIGGGEGRPGLAMNSFMLQPGEENIVAEQLVRLFREHSA